MAKEMNPGPHIVLNLYKRVSETPLQTIERYVASHPEYKATRMTYAGRLDPMAEGVLIVLTGDVNKDRDTYTGLDKDYEFEFVLGIDTDTHDVLGKLSMGSTKKISEDEIKRVFKKYTGTFMQKYPAYSSKVVDGTPLFDIARKGNISSVVLPEHEVNVESLELIGAQEISRKEFAARLESRIQSVKGDFRQREILALWKNYFESEAPTVFTVYKAKVSCGSGFYVRQLVSDLGKDLGTGATTVSILRTRVGDYTISESIK